MQTGEFDFYFADNNANVPVFYNDNEKEIVMCGVEWGIIERTGSWFVCFGQKYQGLNALVTALKADPEMVQKLKEEVLKLIVHKND